VSKDALLAVAEAPSWRIVTAAGAAILLSAGALFMAGRASASFADVQATSEQHEERIAKLERARLIDSFNLYLVCRSDNPNATDCKKPE